MAKGGARVMGPLLMASWVWAGASTLMAALWIVQVRTRNATLVDAGWAIALGGAGVFSGIVGAGEPARRALVGVLAGVWGVRLGVHVLRRVLGGGSEDGRYRLLREHFGRRINVFHAFFFQAQAASVALLCTPFVLAASDPGSSPGALDIAGACLWLVGICGETIADRQLHAFKRDPASRGKVCMAGLWRYSRHPNYFFEWLMWVAYALLASGGPHGVWAWGAPLVMLVLVIRVTGIPPTERQALRTRGEAYREYQRTTSAFVPWFPRVKEQGT